MSVIVVVYRTSFDCTCLQEGLLGVLSMILSVFIKLVANKLYLFAWYMCKVYLQISVLACYIVGCCVYVYRYMRLLLCVCMSVYVCMCVCVCLFVFVILWIIEAQKKEMML